MRMTVRNFCENQGAKIEESTRQYERERERALQCLDTSFLETSTKSIVHNLTRAWKKK